jgi:hypothetical protein
MRKWIALSALGALALTACGQQATAEDRAGYLADISGVVVVNDDSSAKWVDFGHAICSDYRERGASLSQEANSMQSVGGLDWGTGFTIATAACRHLCPDAKTSIG